MDCSSTDKCTVYVYVYIHNLIEYLYIPKWNRKAASVVIRLWPSDAYVDIDQSKVAQLMVCCLTTPSHYQNQMCSVTLTWEQFSVGVCAVKITTTRHINLNQTIVDTMFCVALICQPHIYNRYCNHFIYQAEQSLPLHIFELEVDITEISKYDKCKHIMTTPQLINSTYVFVHSL